MKNCAIYARVSSSEQVKGYSIDAQLDAGRAYAAAQGWEVSGEYIDAGLSGTTDRRPAFKRVIRDALAGQFGVIIVYSFDRFARDLEISVVYKSLLRREGVQVVSVTEQIDDGPMGFINEGIIDLFAAFYSINLSGKIRSGLGRAVEAGKWPWPVPAGYKKVGGWARITEAGAGIQMAFKEFSTGRYTLESWAEAAYKAGLRGPVDNRISASGWSRIFHNRFYIGRLCWNGLEAEGKHEALIDEEIFSMVQQILRKNDQFAARRNPRAYLLAGLLWSVDAGDYMTGALAKGKYAYYRSRSKGRGAAVKHYVRADELENQVNDVLAGVTIAPADIDGLDVDEAMKLALRVAPHVGAIYQWLDDDQQRRALLKLVVARYGFKVAGNKIIELSPMSPFCFWFDIGQVETQRVENFYLMVEVP